MHLPTSFNETVSDSIGGRDILICPPLVFPHFILHKQTLLTEVDDGTVKKIKYRYIYTKPKGM